MTKLEIRPSHMLFLTQLEFLPAPNHNFTLRATQPDLKRTFENIETAREDAWSQVYKNSIGRAVEMLISTAWSLRYRY